MSNLLWTVVYSAQPALLSFLSCRVTSNRFSIGIIAAMSMVLSCWAERKRKALKVDPYEKELLQPEGSAFRPFQSSPLDIRAQRDIA